MFGHQDDESKEQDTAPQQSDNDQPASDDQAADTVLAAVPTLDAAGSPAGDPAWQHPGQPMDGTAPPADVISPAGGFPKAPSFPAAPADYNNPATAAHEPDANDDSTTHELIDIKQHALTELLPLIDKLDQPPEEKFRTLLMMIQASDDQHLVKAAYEAAHGIPDEAVRARALLDIVNEINYFTQQHQQS